LESETEPKAGGAGSSENSLSDTSDPDQANDADELINVGSPVYFNFALPKSGHTLQVRSNLFLINAF